MPQMEENEKLLGICFDEVNLTPRADLDTKMDMIIGKVLF